MNKVKFAVAGCGSIGKRHIGALCEEPETVVTAICDIDETKSREQHELYNIPCFNHYEEMLDKCDADIISIATPHHLHAEMAIKACEKKKNVLVEKPMALSVKDCMKMNEAAYKNRVKLWVVKQNRFNVPVGITKDVIRNGILGKIFMIKCDILWNRHQGYYDESPWRGKLHSEGGALFTQASHFIDLLIWWCGDVVEVAGKCLTQNHKINTEDSGSAVLQFSSGTLGSLVWTTCVYNTNYEGSITIIAEKGTIKIGGKYLNKIEYWNVEEHPLDTNIEYVDKPNHYGKYQGTSSNHDKVIKAIISDLRHGNPGSETVDGFEGMKSIEVIEKIYQAVR